MPKRTKKPKKRKIIRTGIPKTARIGRYNITLKPISDEEMKRIRASKEDKEFARLWNLRLFPFLIKNYDAIVKAEKLRKRANRKRRNNKKKGLFNLF